jgi:hypothetical protein
VALFAEEDRDVDRTALEAEAERASRCLGEELALSVSTV